MLYRETTAVCSQIHTKCSDTHHTQTCPRPTFAVTVPIRIGLGLNPELQDKTRASDHLNSKNLTARSTVL